MNQDKKLNVAIIGQGRSGFDIHGRYFLSEQNTHYKVVAVVDAIEERRTYAQKSFGCTVYSDYRELFPRKDIDVVINATFSYLHYPVTMDLMKHGFNVITEKPFAGYTCECDDMISCSQKNHVMLTIFQQSRYAPYFLKIKEILNSGVLGEIIQISLAFSGFARRWDWQCSQRFYGGNLLNTGPHPLDQVVDLLDYDKLPSITSRLSRANTSGDAEDYAKIIITAPGRPLFDINISSCDAYSDYIYKIQAKNGSLISTMDKCKWKYFIPESQPERPLDLLPLSNEEGRPAYCSEKLAWHEFEEELSGNVFSTAVDTYYNMIYHHLTAGAPLEIKPEIVRRQIAIIEEVHRQNPLPVIY